MEGAQLAVATESIAIERHLVEVATGNKRLHVAAVVVDFLADAAELLVGEFQYSRQAVKAALILGRYLHLTFVAGIVLHIGPHMLQSGTHLYLETHLVYQWLLWILVERFGDAADVVERHIAEAVEFQHLALVYRVVPVNLEHTFHQSGNAVNLIAEKSNNTHPHDVGDIVDGAVLVALQFQLASKTFLGFHTTFYGGDNHVVLLQCTPQYVQYHILGLVQDGEPVAVLVENHLAVHVEFHGRLSDCYDVGEAGDIEDLLHLGVHIEHHHLATAGKNAFLQREEDAESLGGGVGHVRAIDVDVRLGDGH